MNSYREITTSVFSLIQKSLRPLFLLKKPLTKFFFDPPKITPQTPQAFYSTVGPSPPSLLPPIPLETLIYIDPKKNLSEGPLPHGFWQIPQGNDYLSAGVRASTYVTHHSVPYHPQVTKKTHFWQTRLRDVVATSSYTTQTFWDHQIEVSAMSRICARPHAHSYPHIIFPRQKILYPL